MPASPYQQGRAAFYNRRIFDSISEQNPVNSAEFMRGFSDVAKAHARAAGVIDGRIVSEHFEIKPAREPVMPLITYR